MYFIIAHIAFAEGVWPDGQELMFYQRKTAIIRELEQLSSELQIKTPPKRNASGVFHYKITSGIRRVPR